MTYVYPVVSRRAGGLSVGVNLSTNNACNFRCIYCQVPGLVRGKAPAIDVDLLRQELGSMLDQVVRGDFLQRSVPEPYRRLNDVALSGNGEPTASPHLLEAIEIVGEALGDLGLLGAVKLLLITNGSLIHRPRVRRALQRMSEMNGEIWFKLDAVTREQSGRIHSTGFDPARHLDRLRSASRLCPTFIQTCVFSTAGSAPSAEERAAYLGALAGLARDAVPVRGVLLYTLARPPLQPEGGDLAALPQQWLQDFARQIERTGISAQVAS